jgi:hypothetical protein
MNTNSDNNKCFASVCCVLSGFCWTLSFTYYWLFTLWILNWTELNCYIMTDGQSASLSWYQAPFWGLWPDLFNTFRYLRVCWYGAPSLKRGQVCLLQLLLSSPAESFSGPSPAGLMTTFYCLRFETPPTWRTRFLYLYSWILNEWFLPYIGRLPTV